MLTLEEERDGTVALRFVPPDAATDEADYLAALERIGAREAPFVLLTVFAARGKVSPAGDRAQALWFKATRERMNAACRALAIVRPGDPAESARVFGKLWSFPVGVFETEAEGRAFLAPHAPGGAA